MFEEHIYVLGHNASWITKVKHRKSSNATDLLKVEENWARRKRT